MTAAAPPPRRPTLAPSSGPLITRLTSALALQPDFYRAAAADVGGTGPAAAIICVIALIRDAPAIYDLSQTMRVWSIALPVIAVAALLRWLLVGAVAYGSARLGRAPASFASLLRVLAYADAPTMLLALTPWVAPAWFLPAHIVLLAWPYAAAFIALRAACGTTTLRAALLAVPVFLTQQFGLALMRVLMQ
jgi:hypothetical protein